MATIRGSILLLAILALTSCGSRHGSRDEAQKASIAWIKQGGAVTVLTPPNENEIKAQWRRERIAENNRCEFAKQGIEDLERTVPPDNFEENEIQAQYKNLIATRDDACSDRKILVKEKDLTEKQEAKNANARTTNNQCDSFAQQKIYRQRRFQKKIGINGHKNNATLHIDNSERAIRHRSKSSQTAAELLTHLYINHHIYNSKLWQKYPDN